MKFAHLPMDGGLFNQDPVLLDRFQYIFNSLAEEEERKERQRKREQDAQMGTRKPNKVHRPH